MRASLDHITWHSPQLATYWFAPQGYMRFVPGEFTELFIADSNTDGRGDSREFTISSVPTDAHIGITTTFPASGKLTSSFKHALRTLRPGGIVQLAETKGDFVAPRDRSIPMLFIAGGIGITPVLSIITALNNQHDNRKVSIIHSVSSQDALLGKELFSNYCQRYMPIVTQQDTSWRGLSGRLSAQRIFELADITPDTRVYLSGPDTMTDELRQQLLDADVASSQIITDAFTGY